jgi:hypothetical protein
MQKQLPFFPSNTKLINSSLGYRKQDGYVYYLHNGNPIYCHSEADRNGYRFYLGNLIMNNLCSTTHGSSRKPSGTDIGRLRFTSDSRHPI